MSPRSHKVRVIVDFVGSQLTGKSVCSWILIGAAYASWTSSVYMIGKFYIDRRFSDCKNYFCKIAGRIWGFRFSHNFIIFLFIRNAVCYSIQNFIEYNFIKYELNTGNE